MFTVWFKSKGQINKFDSNDPRKIDFCFCCVFSRSYVLNKITIFVFQFEAGLHLFSFFELKSYRSQIAWKLDSIWLDKNLSRRKKYFSSHFLDREKMFEFEIKSPVGKISKKFLHRYQVRDLHDRRKNSSNVGDNSRAILRFQRCNWNLI